MRSIMVSGGSGKSRIESWFPGMDDVLSGADLWEREWGPKTPMTWR